MPEDPTLETAPPPAKPPAMGYQLNAGIKTLLRSAAGVTGTALLMWVQDPGTLTLIMAAIPPRWAGIALALITGAGALHNHFNNRGAAKPTTCVPQEPEK